MSSSQKIRKVPAQKLFVSEPPPQWFGNGANPKDFTKAGWTNGNWLKSRFHFNFAEYSSGPPNFGALRVLNDDLVQPQRMFGSHPHRDAEILTYVVEGELTHQDSRGNKETLGKGSVQFMSAGRGITHSEGNPSDKPLRFVQTWLTPRSYGLTPNYGSAQPCDTKDNWTRVAGDWEDETAKDLKVRLHQDVNVFVAETSKPISFDLKPNRQAYLLCIDGHIDISEGETCNTSLERHDAAELYGPAHLSFSPSPSAHLLMFEMAKSRRS